MPKHIAKNRLQEIAHLPDDALLRVSEAAALEAISLSTAWRRVRYGVWPPVRIGGTTRVRLSDVRNARSLTITGGASNG